MKTITLSATFDGKHIRLEEDFPLRKDARLLVTVLPEGAEDEAEFREFWRQLSAQSLSRAYGADEPELHSRYGARAESEIWRPVTSPPGGWIRRIYC